MSHRAKMCLLPRRILTVFLINAAAGVASAGAAVIFDNFDNGGGFDPQSNLVAAQVFRLNTTLVTTRAAARFTVTGGDFTLTSITLPISVQNSVTGDFLRMRLTADAAGAPGSTLEVLSENQAIWPAFSNPFTTTTTVSSTVHPLLMNGASYWIVTEPTSIPAQNPSTVDYRWFRNTSGSTVPFRQQQKSGALPSDPWDGLNAPNSPAFLVEGNPSLVSADASLPPRFELGLPWPNPADREVNVAFHLSAPAIVRSAVFDETGRLVRAFDRGTEPASEGTIRWDGRDGAGRRTPPGVYFIEVESGAESRTVKIARVR